MGSRRVRGLGGSERGWVRGLGWEVRQTIVSLTAAISLWLKECGELGRRLEGLSVVWVGICGCLVSY